MRNLISIFLITAIWSLISPVVAQEMPLRGMVWDVPKSEKEALSEMKALHKIGVRALRTNLVWRDTLFALADSMGMYFFQELPFSDLSVAELRRMLPFAIKTLSKNIEKSKKYRSARYFGLAQNCDTSDPAAMVYFSGLMNVIRTKGAPFTQGYYTTSFTKRDQAFPSVDFVLVKAIDRDDPIALTQQMSRQTNGKAMGVVLGMGVSRENRMGYKVQNSPEAQARYLERKLNRLVYTSPVPLKAIFVYRWKDVSRSIFSQSATTDHNLHYGLWGTDKKPRPGYDVVKGIYTGKQTVFAFKAGSPLAQDQVWMIILGWVIVALIVIAYILSYRLQDILPRFFLAHDSYQEYLLRSRDAHTGTNALLMVAFGLCAGLSSVIIFYGLRPYSALGYFVEELPAMFQFVVLAALRMPWSFSLFATVIFAATMIFIALLLYGLARYFGQQTITPQKTLMVTVWAQWPMVILMLTAMVTFNTWGTSSMLPPLYLIGFWGLLNILAFFQIAYDFAYIVKKPFWMLALGGLAAFALISIVFLLFRFPEMSSEWNFLTNLIKEGLERGVYVSPTN
ncbi:MAG: hypothetical protein J0L94_04900 [Rhodothermia bacterium]|nr:hypothetical protein [Rhodothermia bacterium]